MSKEGSKKYLPYLGMLETEVKEKYKGGKRINSNIKTTSTNTKNFETSN